MTLRHVDDLAARRRKTERARAVALQRFLDEVDPSITDPAERERAAAEARSRHFALLGKKSGDAKRRARIARLTAELTSELAHRQRTCPHRWPGDLDAAATCMYCGLPYADYAEELAGAA